MTFGFIEAEKASFPISRMCRVPEVSQSGFFAWPVAPNLIAQDFVADAPDRKWGADISYIWTADGWLHLAVVLDLFSRPSPWTLNQWRHHGSTLAGPRVIA